MCVGVSTDVPRRSVCDECQECPMPGGVLRCSVCKSGYYCRRRQDERGRSECQLRGWSKHKRECERLKAERAENKKAESQDTPGHSGLGKKAAEAPSAAK